MRTDSRLSRMLHVLLHMARDDQPVTSERIAQMLGTNPAVVRRTMGGLREAGYVRSEKGHGGGWTLDCDLAQVTLLDVYRAVGSERLFAMGFDNVHPDCLVEKVVNAALQDAMEQATAILLERLGAVSLADLAERFTALYPKDH
ncbi:Rrf2 family transcriptional regulator [Pseudomonas sp. PDM18]|uniref:Rrf2 family transcriptional regulator n=1 Tax=unclassified Pseudomonas TaxID=196821 RepID=UPI001785B500|nr:Rrf2 family transcriptional regulator [Pseudomonas sp. PDM18]MBD9676084.1 Rrf2 family transcriptional regulator [Pseudomonas sp. PDM18]